MGIYHIKKKTFINFSLSKPLTCNHIENPHPQRPKSQSLGKKRT